jgi:Na+-transporting NADH:ubiquinone oxidoreductase subunit NqrD
MSQAAKSLFVFGVYLCALGLLLLLGPNLLLQLFGVPPTHEVWIRINGMFVLCLSFYYVQAARNELTTFIRWTIPARIAVIIYFAAFVLLVSAPKALLLFGLIDLLAALWTWLALKKDATR